MPQPVSEHATNIATLPDYPADPHILDYVRILAGRKWIAIGIVLFSTIAFLGVTYIMPYTYEADGRLLPPDRVSSAGLLSALNASGALKILKEVENPSVDLIQNLLESRTLAVLLSHDSAIRSYFMKRSQSESELLANITDAIVVKPGYSKMDIVSNVSTGWLSSAAEKHRVRVLPAHIVNLSIRYMDSLLTDLLKSEDQIHLNYALSDYEARKRELDSAEADLERFEKNNGVVQLQIQTRTAIDELAEIEKQKLQAEIEESSLSNEFTPQAAARKKAGLLASATRSAIQELAVRSSISPSLSELPAVQKEYAGLVLRRTVLEPIVSYLYREVEQQRVNVARNKSLITYLDPAGVPEVRSSPKRIPMLLLGLTSGIVLVIVYIGFLGMRDSVAFRDGGTGRE